MSEEPSSPPEERDERDLLDEIAARIPIAQGSLIDLLSALLLSAAVVLSAFSAWQASLWGGEQSTLYAEASSARIQSNAEMAISLTRLSYDAGTFVDAATAFTNADQATVDLFNERLFREEFKVFVDEWVALDPLNNPDAPRTPFELDGFAETYLAESIRLSDVANDKFEAGKKANEINDNYVLATVLFAGVLFFSGISTKFKSPGVRALSIGMATFVLAASFVWVLTLPRLFQT